MKLKWIVLASLWLFAMHSRAEQGIVIDTQSIGDAPPAAKTEANPSAQGDATPTSQAEANRERILKGGRLSPREKNAMAKAAKAEANKQESDPFLAANKVKPGVVTLADGVQYKILKGGKGKKPTDSSVVSCRYQAKLIDGSTFDKTDAKKPSDMNVAGFLPGLKEVVKLMSPGAKWQIVIPPQQAFGEQGNRGVGANAVVIYDMEIVAVK